MLQLTLAFSALLLSTQGAPLSQRAASLRTPEGAAELIALQGGTFLGVPVTFKNSPGQFVLTADTGSSYSFINGAGCDKCPPNVKWYGGSERVVVNANATAQVNGTAGCSDPKQPCPSAGLTAPAFTDAWGHKSVVWMQDVPRVGTATPVRPTQFGVIQADDEKEMSGDEASGALGLGPVELSNLSPYYRNFPTSQFAFGFHKQLWKNTSASPGWMQFSNETGSRIDTWRDWVVDPDKVEWTPVVSESYPPRYWTVNLTGLSMGSNKVSIQPNVSTIIDTGNWNLWLPRDTAAALFANTPLTLGESGYYWPCSDTTNGQLPHIALQMQGTSGDLYIDLAYLSVPYSGSDAPTSQAMCGGIGITDDGSTAMGNFAIRSFVTLWDGENLRVGFQQRKG